MNYVSNEEVLICGPTCSQRIGSRLLLILGGENSPFCEFGRKTFLLLSGDTILARSCVKLFHLIQDNLPCCKITTHYNKETVPMLNVPCNITYKFYT